ncbi:MAG: cytochrome c oxidase subunit II [Chromatiales bacterium]|nr:MAG: cytochrome c oxidase subunit II [Chromatiales bacterium]
MSTNLRKHDFNTFLTALVASLLGNPAQAAWEVNMPVGVTDASAKIFDLHMLIFWVCVVIAVIVFSAMIYCLVAFRKSKGAVPATFSHSTTAEIVWTVIPVLILVAMAVPAAQTLVEIDDTRDTEMTIKITGYQWKWQYEYVGEDVSFYSNLAASSNETRQLRSGIDPFQEDNYLLDVDRPLVVPADTKIRYLITSNDVIHAWWVPDFAVKKDAIPGFINEGWFRVNEPGVYRGQCAELCGKDHGFMPVVVEVLPREEFTAWLAGQQGGAAVASAATAR